ncbi:MAG: rhodanese-like domain-containing protein [Dehalococcoidales bacterium]
MKKQIFLITLLLLFLTLSVSLYGCDYISGKALGETSPVPPRWVWSNVDDTFPSKIVDRNTHELIKDVTPYEAFGIMGTSSYLGNPVVIDVRTPQEYAGGHVWQAINIDYNSASFKDKISKLDKTFTYIVYCQTGYRSNLARKVMEERGFNYVINMTGGYGAWVAAGLPIEK